MREKLIEQKLIKAVKDIGGIALKIVSPGFDGIPDRLILLPNRKIAFVEVKAPGKTLRPLQEKRKRQLEALGFLVFCLDNLEQIGGILREIQAS
ncbi:VRR-NUC domain-containing protein [Clostridium aciditolerans]|uniref:VRR-NUC domain-containing protein n=1 Tax=Clostridium aciditolerans TaxID=339861 RepID=A0A934M3P4_9CLOT|nr:VRR-NUC domain-containing protein [Clostridium aciditolerans]MBI6873402.1 VRR-NUC domain-containing protein [Clostridium aciditolerans]